MTLEQLRDHLCSTYPQLCPLFSVEFGDGTLTVDAEGLFEAASDLKDLGFDRLGMVTAVDYINHFEMVYRMTSCSMSVGMFLKCVISRENPSVQTLVPLWPSALWQEREVFDLFGIVFQGHPDMRRILLPEDWSGHPLRKDYVDEQVIPRPDYV